MPSIEIVSIGTDKLGLPQADFEIAIIEENRLIGHRGLFNDFLKNKIGVMIHLGNPDLRNEKEYGFFAGQIINWDFEPGEIAIPNMDNGETGTNQQFRFQFKTYYQIEIAKIINIGLTESPSNDLYFMTDYQFGPEEGKIEDLKLTDFWTRHDNEGLEWNTLYKLRS
ncbi:hypothetical protein [Mangrovibacterium diazotrophicum]|uniref:Uncharacterized protein n=1 Tax=Mangrovibacterium diazotrophicum TaxID=1261403 RepID=A0A419VX27_9BACT|nr:hypothetical protein [Mangrovibacterium diazotrophicum]RKD87768.1 hypothetical protein BC643_3775 [Mangrovibacterium diazotrophicum]